MRAEAIATPSGFAADLSLALINRTGAYHVCRDLVSALPDRFTSKRYWRFDLEREPGRLLRRGLGKAMLSELAHAELTAWLPAWNARSGGQDRTVFFDPLYVLRSRLDERDIVLCHDVGPISHPEFYRSDVAALYAKAYRQICQARPNMVFVSEASRDAFVAIFGSDFPTLAVVPLYVRSGVVGGDARRPASVTPPFLLTVAALESRKNYGRVMEAFTGSGLYERGFSYVFCGPRGSDTREIRALASQTQGVTWLGFLEETELRWVYRNASGFVLPSLLEGFGLPALEAAQQGLLSLVSDSGALPEAVGGNAILVDPYSVDDIARGMREMVDMPSEKKAARIRSARAFAAELTFERYVEGWSRLLGSL